MWAEQPQWGYVNTEEKTLRLDRAGVALSSIRGELDGTALYDLDKDNGVLGKQLEAAMANIVSQLNTSTKNKSSLLGKFGFWDTGDSYVKSEIGSMNKLIKTAFDKSREGQQVNVQRLISELQKIVPVTNPKANPEHVVANKNSNPDTNALLSFVKGNTGIGKTVGNRTPGDIK